MLKQKQALQMRVWHWLNALTVTGLLGTVLLRNTFFSVKKNTALILEELSGTTPVSTDSAKAAARHIREQMFEWHYYLGIGLALLFLFRAFFVKASFFPRPTEVFRKGKHFGLVKIFYGLFYGVLGYMVLSGVSMYISNEYHWFTIPSDWFEKISEVHEVFQWFFVFFIAVHLGGVIYAENTSDPGLVSEMIHGSGPGSTTDHQSS
jgi:cytochrome b561